jgi:cytochrome bd-type quinol oxidase subunit 1
VPGAYIALTLVGYALVYTLLMISYMVVITQLALKEADGGHAAAQPAGTQQPVAG